MNGTKAQTQRTMQTTNRDPAEQPTGRLPARQLERNCSLSESLGALSATLGETSRPSCAGASAMRKATPYTPMRRNWKPGGRAASLRTLPWIRGQLPIG